MKKFEEIPGKTDVEKRDFLASLLVGLKDTLRDTYNDGEVKLLRTMIENGRKELVEINQQIKKPSIN